MSYKKFGVLLCPTAGGIMKPDKIKELIDDISLMGYNVLEMCIDEIYKIEGEPYFGYLNGSYSKEELKELDSYARLKGVELIPSIQTLGHLGGLLSIPHYFGIKDTGDVLLIDEPKTYELIDKMFATIAECFTTREVNIGYDEAHGVGLGAYLKKHGYKDRFELLLKHLNRVNEIAKGHGFKIHMWVDMFFKMAQNDDGMDCYPAKGVVFPQKIIDLVPENIGLCYWDYLSEDEDMYDSMLRSCEMFNNELWFAGSCITYWGFAPLNTLTLKCSEPAFKQVVGHGVQNVLVCLWQDYGNECSSFSALPTLFALRQFADNNFDMGDIKAKFKKMFGLDFDNFMKLELPCKNQYNPNMDQTDGSTRTLLYKNDCFLGKRDYWIDKMDAPTPYGEYRDELLKISPEMGKYSYLFDLEAALCDVLELKSTLGVRTRRAYAENNIEELKSILADYHETVKRLKVFRDLLRARWMKENKPYNWNVHEERLGAVRARIEDCAERLQDYIDGKDTEIPELTEEIQEYWLWRLIHW